VIILVMAFLLLTATVSSASPMMRSYKSVCYDNFIDKRFCCVAEMPLDEMREVCMKIDGSDVEYHSYSERIGTLDEYMEIAKYPSSYPLCRTPGVKEYPDGYPCVDSDGEFRVDGKVVNISDYFGKKYNWHKD
jgi:hypothetical protein